LLVASKFTYKWLYLENFESETFRILKNTSKYFKIDKKSESTKKAKNGAKHKIPQNDLKFHFFSKIRRKFHKLAES